MDSAPSHEGAQASQVGSANNDTLTPELLAPAAREFQSVDVGQDENRVANFGGPEQAAANGIVVQTLEQEFPFRDTESASENALNPVGASATTWFQDDPVFISDNSFVPRLPGQCFQPSMQSQHPQTQHPDFLDPNTLAQELSRMNLAAPQQQAQPLHFCNQPQISLGHQVYTLFPVGPSVSFAAAAYEPSSFGAQAARGQGGPPQMPFIGTADRNRADATAAHAFVGQPQYVDEFGNIKPEILAVFQAQQLRFPELPQEAHRKIQTMPGYQITTIYPVRLIRFLSSTLVESTNSFAVFTKKPETGQNWLMAFAVKRDRIKTAVKFNRLLTAHLKVTVVGETAVELESSRLSKSFMGEQYVFILRSAEGARSFLDTLDYGRSEIWTCHGQQQKFWGVRLNSLRSRSNFDGQGSGQAPPDSSRPGPSTSRTSMRSSSTPPRSSSRSNQRYQRNPLFCDNEILRSVESRLLESASEPKKEEISIIAQHIMFSAYVTLFIDDFEITASDDGHDVCPLPVVNEVNSGLPCKQFGSGMLCVVDRPGTQNEVMFVVNNTEIVCHHKIFAWNEIVMDNERDPDKIICVWNCLPVFANEENALPKLRQLLVKFEDRQTAADFHAAFSEAKLKATEMTKRSK